MTVDTAEQEGIGGAWKEEGWDVRMHEQVRYLHLNSIQQLL